MAHHLKIALDMKAVYPLADYPSYKERVAIGIDPKQILASQTNIRAVRTGEFREPKAGEWYLSGSVVEAWKAPNDLPTMYHIARLVRVEVKHTTTETIVQE